MPQPSASHRHFNPWVTVLTGSATRISGLFTPDALRRTDDAEGLKQALSGAGEHLVPGTTVTARTRYKVAPDGSLVATDRRVTVHADEQAAASDADGRRSSRRAFDRQETLANLLPPRASLSPADELALFGEGNGAESATNPPLITRVAVGQATAEDGSPIAVDIIRPQAEFDQLAFKTLAAQAQGSAAARYAHNNDIVFNVSSYTQIAA